MAIARAVLEATAFFAGALVAGLVEVTGLAAFFGVVAVLGDAFFAVAMLNGSFAFELAQKCNQ
ncbi:MAG: hypothetical protein BWK72_20060 [Rhodoferax ferrireducens]|uniref:Uncharacterized protein n=1 Tax=Rhodoferax ferrireducens TaxID=192843 RepID=A0A1W9KNV8_9BURK|nr:MAG: hypothetical protein BWK72_20060 [Rhodoferax ferrireducens]